MRTFAALLFASLASLAMAGAAHSNDLAKRTPAQAEQIEAGLELYKRLCDGPVTRDCSTCLRSGACYKAKRDAAHPINLARRSPEQLEAAHELHRRLCDGPVTRDCSTCLRSGACYKA